MALIDDGKIVAKCSIDKLLQDYKQENLEHLFLNLTGKEFRDDV